MTHNTKVIFPYEKEDQEKLVAAFTEQKGNKLRFRYRWGVVLILETGLRAGEALALERNDITYNRYIHIFEGDIDDTLRQAVGA